MTAPVRLPIRQGTPEWLAARRDTIGSSDIPVILGDSPYKSAHTLAAEKLGLVSEDIDDESRLRMDIGTLLQPSLLRIYERIEGRATKASPGWLRHPQIEWATASLDGTAPVKRVIEAKWTNATRWRSGERVPADVEEQVQWQLFITGWDVADVVALEHGTPRIETIERDDSFIDDILWAATEFHGYLERGELPPADGSDSTRRTLIKRFPADDGTWLPATDDLIEMVRELAAARSDKKTAEERESTVGNALRALLADASGIDGLLAAKKNADSTRVNWPAVAKAYRLLLEGKGTPAEELAALETIHSETSQGARPLRLLKGATAA